MFLTISWADYRIYTIIILALYYSALVIMYKQQLLRGFQTKTNAHNIFSSINKRVDEAIETPLSLQKSKGDHNNSLVHDLVDEIQAYTSAVGEDEEKEIILSGISMILKKYPTLENTHLQESIEELISVSCENNCSVYLSESEIRGLWQKAG